MLGGAVVRKGEEGGEVREDAVRGVHPGAEGQEWDATTDFLAGGQAAETVTVIPATHRNGDRLDVC